MAGDLASGSKADLRCEWMFADAATGLLGFNSMAHLNPLRWSGRISMHLAIENLRQLSKEGKQRPILLKLPPRFSETERLHSIADAVDRLERFRDVLEKDASAEANRDVVMDSGFSDLSAVNHKSEEDSNQPVPNAEINQPQLRVREAHVDMQHKFQACLEVPVHEKHFHKNVSYVPAWEQRDVERQVRVREVRCKEVVALKEDWQTEESTVTVPRTEVRQDLQTKSVSQFTQEEEIVEVVVGLPVVERVVERPNVIVEENLEYVTVPGETVSHEETVELPVVVEVPRVVPVVHTEHIEVQKEVVVPHIREAIKVVEAVQKEIEQVEVEVPRIHHTRTIKFVPKFVAEDGGEIVDRGMDNQQALAEARTYIQALEGERQDLRQQLGDSLSCLTEKKRLVDEERKTILHLRQQLQGLESFSPTRGLCKSKSVGGFAMETAEPMVKQVCVGG